MSKANTLMNGIKRMDTGKFIARFYDKGLDNSHLGTYDTLEAAVDAYNEVRTYKWRSPAFHKFYVTHVTPLSSSPFNTRKQ